MSVETSRHAHPSQFGLEPAPCPFCGRKNLRIYMGPQPHVCCMSCDADGPLAPRKSEDAGPRIAVDLWNRRVTTGDARDGN